MRRLILRSFQSPGDVVMLTAAVRDLHKAHPGRFQTDVRTAAQALWNHNPWITPLDEQRSDVECIDMHYPLIHESNRRPYHFLHGYIQFLEQRLGIHIPLTAFRGDVHLADEEMQWAEFQQRFDLPDHYWIMVAGGKYDFTAKWWNPASYQAVVDHFRSTIDFVQCGEAGHWHPPRNGVTNLVGRTTLREFIQLVHFSEGVVCPVTLAMHLAAAVDRPDHRPGLRPCVVVAGGREPAHWEAYPGHQYLHTVGMLDCCATGGCWRSRCQTVGDGDPKDHRQKCERPVAVSNEFQIPECLALITPQEVIQAIDRYRPYVGQQTSLPTRNMVNRPTFIRATPPVQPNPARLQSRFLLDCRKGKLDRGALAITLRHLRHYYPQYEFDVLVNDKDSREGLSHGGRFLLHSAEQEPKHPGRYQGVFPIKWQACDYEPRPWPNHPATRCLLEDFHLTPIPDFFRSPDSLPIEKPHVVSSEQTPAVVTPTPRTRIKPHRLLGHRHSLSVRFYHGLGDCAFFAHLIPLYQRRGYQILVECTPDKKILFAAAGAKVIASGKLDHPWAYPAEDVNTEHDQPWVGSKPAHNLAQPPLPAIGTPAELWDEYCRERVDVEPFLSATAHQIVDRWLGNLPRPVVLLHTKANTSQSRKSLPDRLTLEFYRALLDRMPGSLILLDWDDRVPRLPSWRVRHLEDLGQCPTDVLLALMNRADLLIGVDSGPLHLARMTNIPSVGVWMPGHYPARYSLPRREQLNIVLSEPTKCWNRFKRIPWNIVEHPGAKYDAEQLATICTQMLKPARYLGSDQLAADIQLQQFIRQYCRGRSGQELSEDVDRHRSFDRLFQEITPRFPNPTIVETGTIRGVEDWDGAGFFTYLAGTYLSRRGVGKLHSVDISQASCEFARTETKVFGDSVEIHLQDSVSFLNSFSQPIDVLVLDSLDTSEPGHAEHGLREMQAAQSKLHERSLIVFDDTPWAKGQWRGKGALAVPWLLERGWHIFYAGYQVLLSRT